MPSTTPQGTPAAERPSVGRLVAQLSEQVARLVRAEIDLARTELVARAKQAGIGAGLLAGAGLLSLYALAALLAAAVLGLAVVVPVWLAALIVGVVLLVVAGVLALVGRRSLARGLPPTPQRAIDNVKQDVATLTEGRH